MLKYVIAEPIQLIAEFEVVRSQPSALKPCRANVGLDGLIGVTFGKVNRVRNVNKTSRLLERSRQGIAENVRRSYAVGVPLRQSAGCRISKVVIVLEIIAKPAGQNQPRRDGVVYAGVRGGIRRREP